MSLELVLASFPVLLYRWNSVSRTMNWRGEVHVHRKVIKLGIYVVNVFECG